MWVYELLGRMPKRPLAWLAAGLISLCLSAGLEAKAQSEPAPAPARSATTPSATTPSVTAPAPTAVPPEPFLLTAPEEAGTAAKGSIATAPEAETPELTAPAPPPRSSEPSDWALSTLARLVTALWELGARFWGALLILAVLIWTMRRFAGSHLYATMMRTLSVDVLTNWRLVLLGATGVVLSLASGYTTWDGMTNFTCPARGEGGFCVGPMVLSLAITFGIQGVMLIAAWLIGESFAHGLGSNAPASYREAGPAQRWASLLVVVPLVLAGLVVVAIVLKVLGSQLFAGGNANAFGKSLVRIWEDNTSGFTWLGVVLGVCMLVGLAVTQREVFGPYVRGVKIIARNLPVWAMFLACMATSVFFSFDSLFSTIFPKDERARAADIRTQGQVSGLISDLGSLLVRRRAESGQALFQTDEWQDFQARMAALVKLARAAPGEIRQTVMAEMERQKAVTTTLRQQKTTAESRKAALEKDKAALLADLKQLSSALPPIEVEVERLKSDVFKKDSEIIGKKAEAEAERGGVGGTGKAGAGPEFAKRRKELADLTKLKAILDQQLKERSAQLQAARDTVATREAEIARVDGELAKLDSEIEVATQQIAIQSQVETETASTTDVTGGFDALERALAQFRQRPERTSFEAIQQNCSALVKAFDGVPSLKQQAASAGIDCATGSLAEPLARVLALNDSVSRFRDGCGKGENLPSGRTDVMLDYAARCVQNSGLPGADTEAFRTLLNRISLNRDDKAHRFVVTWNAFLDGNQLAYLALAIAIAIDGLVFMSGLFGANAVRSPLTDAPHGRNYTASELEAIVTDALQPDIYDNAHALMAAARPITRDDQGFAAEVTVSSLEPTAVASIVKVLNQASTLNLVRQDGSRYLIRGELLHFLGEVCSRELRINEAVRGEVERERRQIAAERLKVRLIEAKAKDLEPIIEAALLPHVYHHAALVMSCGRPIVPATNAKADAGMRDEGGAATEIDVAGLAEPRAAHVVLGVLNAAAAYGAAEPVPDGSGRFRVSPQLQLCLAEIKARAISQPIGEEPAYVRAHFEAALVPPPRRVALAPATPSLPLAGLGTIDPGPPEPTPQLRFARSATSREEMWRKLMRLLGVEDTSWPMIANQILHKEEPFARLGPRLPAEEHQVAFDFLVDELVQIERHIQDAEFDGPALGEAYGLQLRQLVARAQQMRQQGPAKLQELAEAVLEARALLESNGQPALLN